MAIQLSCSTFSICQKDAQPGQRSGRSVRRDLGLKAGKLISSKVCFFYFLRNSPGRNSHSHLIGVNMARENLVSLHTTSSCMMPQQRYQAGQTISTNCDAKANFNQGCGTQSTKGTSYGSVFNTVGGGFYVMARSVDNGIRVWFWQRDDPQVPQSIREGWGSVSPDPSWGIPEASFPNADFCDYNSHFDDHMIVFDLTFCVSSFQRFSCHHSHLNRRATGLARITRTRDVGRTARIVSIETVLHCSAADLAPSRQQ